MENGILPGSGWSPWFCVTSGRLICNGGRFRSSTLAALAGLRWDGQAAFAPWCERSPVGDCFLLPDIHLEITAQASQPFSSWPLQPSWEALSRGTRKLTVGSWVPGGLAGGLFQMVVVMAPQRAMRAAGLAAPLPARAPKELFIHNVRCAARCSDIAALQRETLGVCGRKGAKGISTARRALRTRSLLQASPLPGPSVNCSRGASGCCVCRVEPSQISILLSSLGVSVSERDGLVGLRGRKMPLCCSFHLLRRAGLRCCVPFVFAKRGMREEGIWFAW